MPENNSNCQLATGDLKARHLTICRQRDRGGRRGGAAEEGNELRVIAGGLQNVLSRLTGPQQSVLSRDELKATWEAYDKEDSEDIMQIIAREPQLIDSKDEVGSTPLSLAVENGNTAIAAVLLDHGADMTGDDVCVLTVGVQYGSNMLHIAAQTGNKEMVEMLLAGGADVTAEDEVRGCHVHFY
ncbi:Ankyrin repeat-containing domain [Phytophthora cactorum]|nr:Ankyrin repeat-containing domain [Phytophthora cactorum]